MFDNLRQKSAEEAEFLNVEDPEETVVATTTTTKTVKPRAIRKKVVRRGSGGLTPMQGFVLALMLFLNVSVLGFFALLVFERIALPF
jgi:hypothetical protein